MGQTKRASIGTYGIWKTRGLDSDGQQTGNWKQAYTCKGAEFAITTEEVSENYDTIFELDTYMTAVKLEVTINDAVWTMPDASDTDYPPGDWNVFQDLWGISAVTGIQLAESASDDTSSGQADFWAVGSNLNIPYVAAYYRCYLGPAYGSGRRIFELEVCKCSTLQFTLGFGKTDTTRINIPLRALLNSAVTAGGSAGTFLIVKKSTANYQLPSGG